MTITPTELAKVRNRHAGIEQDPLPLDVLDTPPQTAGGSEVKTKTIKSIKWARCPHHAPGGKKQLTGLIQLDASTLAFRDHTKKVGKHTMPCPGSGQVWDGDTSDDGR